jgi:multicomponent Na+:H+ antiporter subunit F
MNEWHIAVCVLLGGIAACAWVAARGSFLDALVALQLAGTLAALALLALAEAEGRDPFGDLAIVLAAVSLAGSLMFARYLERVGAEETRAKKIGQEAGKRSSG